MLSKRCTALCSFFALLHNYSKKGAYIDLHYMGENEKEVLDFMVTNCSNPDYYKGKIKLPERKEE